LPAIADDHLSRDDFLWILGSLCNIHRLAFEPTLLLSQFAPPYDFAKLKSAAEALGLEVKLSEHDATDAALERLPVPFVALSQTVPKEDAPRDHPAAALVVKVAAGKVLYFPAGQQASCSQDEPTFRAQFAAPYLLFHPQVPVVEDEDAPKATEAFGFSWFVPELLKHKRIWQEILLASLFIQLIALVTPLCTQVVIDKVVVNQTMNTLYTIAFALGAFLVFTAVLTWLRQYLVLHTGNRVDAVLGTAVFERLVKLPIRYFEHRATGVVAARLHGVETIREFISGAAVTLLLDLPFIFIFLAIMLYYSVVLTMITLGVVIVIAALSLFLAPIFQERLNQQFMLGARNQAFLTEYVSGMETVKSLQMEPILMDKYSGFLAAYLDSSFKTRQLSNHYGTVTNALEQAMSVAILCFGAYQVMTRPDFTIGMLVAFQMFSGRVSQPILRLTGLWQQFQQAQISVKRLGDIMDAPPEPYSVVPQTQARGRGQIEFRNVSFQYDRERPFLYQGLNLSIAPGECVSLMGPSGSGKSTLAKLLQGFYLPTEGQILIDGKDYRFLSANELRSLFGVVPQETTLFSGTIYENLLLANPHATFEMVVEACRLAEVHEVVERLPKGYQTEIGERGVGLSGGQKQRLAIARALIKQPRVLIFDEATSSLDADTAEQFATTVNRLKGKVSMLFITHQLPASLLVDRALKISDLF
jgi:subfamily B ATP-binding cassette protein HlyB/CyaB